VNPQATSAEWLEWLFETGGIELERSPLLAAEPPAFTSLSWDRVEGMLLGLAIGDALGNTTEGMIPPVRSAQYGEIRDYLPNRHADGRRVGVPSDDTQLAFWTLEHLIEHGRLSPETLAERFSAEQIFGIGSTVKEFLHRFNGQGHPWYLAGPQSAGNGALMRVAPLLLPHLRAPSPMLWADTALAAMLTHNDRGSTASCIAEVDLLWRALALTETPAPEWYLDVFTATARELEGETCYRSRAPGTAYEGPLWRFVEAEVRPAVAGRGSVWDACERWYSGAFLLETVPCVLMILARHGDDPEAAIVRAVNDTKDNDTVAAIVGAVVGALHGSDALPARWRAGLLGRTSAADDGRIFEFLDRARKRFFD
jgi:ADP-ribosylglycohydrolase